MGTSNIFGGQSNNSPLVPSWVDSDGAPPAAPDGIPPTGPDATPSEIPDELEPDRQPPDGAEVPATPPSPPPYAPIPPIAESNRFSAARSNFSRFVSSGGTDRRSLGRAMSHYVGSSTRNARTAANRMGSSRGASGRLLGFLSDAIARGASEALQEINLGEFAVRPIEEIFLGMVDYICPDGGSIDEGIAREAFIETIADLAGAGIEDLDTLSTKQMHTVFELYATNAIEARLCNDIGKGIITLPSNISHVERVQEQLHDFIQRGVADAITAAHNAASALTPKRVSEFVGRIYEQAFSILQIMASKEAI